MLNFSGRISFLLWPIWELLLLFSLPIFIFGVISICGILIPKKLLIFPLPNLQNKLVLFTFHQDTPTLLPNMLNAVWCAVNRKSRRGTVLGEEEQVSILDALKAITIHAAYQYFEEDSKGSIEVGKRADFVVLDFNPLRVRPADIKRVRVLKTIKDDRVIYERE